MRSVKITIHGRVQGVFFRDSAKRKAEQIGIFGWVKNAVGGTVEILAQGEPEKLNEFIQWCKKGPQGAKVERVEVEKVNNEKDFKNFGIKF